MAVTISSGVPVGIELLIGTASPSSVFESGDDSSVASTDPGRGDEELEEVAAAVDQLESLPEESPIAVENRSGGLQMSPSSVFESGDDSSVASTDPGVGDDEPEEVAAVSDPSIKIEAIDMADSSLPPTDPTRSSS